MLVEDAEDLEDREGRSKQGARRENEESIMQLE